MPRRSHAATNGRVAPKSSSRRVEEPSPETVSRARAVAGADVPTAPTWQALWEESGLQERVVKLYQVDPRAEVRSRIRWVGWSWAVRAAGRRTARCALPEVRALGSGS